MPAVLTPTETRTLPVTVLPPEITDAGEQRILLSNVSWATYQQLMRDYESSSAPRFTYLQGNLEITMPSHRHEGLSELFKQFVHTVCEAWELEFLPFGSTTYSREDLLGGAEPDGCFYIQNVERVADADELDLTIHPPPDLLFEIDLSSPSLNKFPFYAALGVPEIWHYKRRRITIFALQAAVYQQVADSQVLPGVSREILPHFLATSRDLRRLNWLRSVREWARQNA